ncbi:hypothetical protein D3C81_1782000 [compost metagenome]
MCDKLDQCAMPQIRSFETGVLDNIPKRVVIVPVAILFGHALNRHAVAGTARTYIRRVAERAVAYDNITAVVDTHAHTRILLYSNPINGDVV